MPPLTKDQHFTLAQMVQLGRQKLDEMLTESLEAIRPQEETPHAESVAEQPPASEQRVSQSEDATPGG